MTTNYHTAITTGAAANASTINTPLGTIDAQLTTTTNEVITARGTYANLDLRLDANDTTVSNVNGEVQGARGSFADLEARLDALTYGGSGINTTANGTQTTSTTLAVTSGASIINGAWLAITTTAGNIELRKVSAGGGTNTLTLTQAHSGVTAGGLISMLSAGMYEISVASPYGNSVVPTMADAVTYAGGGTYNALAYHATGTPGLDAADDTAAIQAAIDAAELANGGRVLVPDGTWFINATLTHDSGRIDLAGASRRGTVLQAQLATFNDILLLFDGVSGSTISNLSIISPTTSSYSQMIVLDGGCADVEIHNVKIDGAYITAAISTIALVGTTATVTTTAAHGFTSGDVVFVEATGTGLDNVATMTVTDIDEFTYTNVYTVDTSASTGRALRPSIINAVHFANAEHCTVRDSAIAVGAYTGVRFGVDADGCACINCYVTDHQRGFMWDSGSANCLVDGCYVTEIHGLIGKMETEAVGQTIAHHRFTNNRCAGFALYTESTPGSASYRNTTAGLNVVSIGAVVTGNTLTSDGFIGDAAIRVESSNVRIAGNHITGISQGYGIWLKNAAAGVQIDNNLIDGQTNLAFGIFVEDGSTYVAISNNLIRACETGIRIYNAYHWSISGGLIDGASAGDGIACQTTRNGAISGVTVMNSYRYGINLSNSASAPSREITVTGCTVINSNVGLSGTGRGILCGANARYITITGCTVRNIRADTWVTGTAYEAYDYVAPTSPGLYIYRCSTRGTSSTPEPTWPTTVGATVTDGTVVWTCELLSTTPVLEDGIYVRTIKSLLVVGNTSNYGVDSTASTDTTIDNNNTA